MLSFSLTYGAVLEAVLFQMQVLAQAKEYWALVTCGGNKGAKRSHSVHLTLELQTKRGQLTKNHTVKALRAVLRVVH